MNPSDRHLFWSLAFLAAASHGCDRQMVFTAPREPTVRPRPRDKVRVKPRIINEAPPSTPLPPSRGIDVPILTPG